MKKLWPGLKDKTIDAVYDCLKGVTQTRQDDLGDWKNLAQTYILGRKSNKVPSSSTDTTGDNVGDVNYDASYLYICINNTGTAAWRRVALSTW